MDARKDADFGAEFADFVELAAVGADVVAGDVVADVIMKRCSEGFVVGVFSVLRIIVDDILLLCDFLWGGGDCHFLVEFPAEFVDHLIALGVWEAKLSAEFAGDPFVDGGLDFFIWEDDGVFEGGGLYEIFKLVLEGDGRLEVFVGPLEGIDDDLLGDFVCGGFDHRDARFDAGDDEVEVGLNSFFWAEESLKLAIDAADTETGDWAVKWRAGEHKCSAGGDHGDAVWAEVRVGREDGGDDLDFLAVAFREKRADWAVDEATDEDGFVGWAAFAFNESAAGDFAGGVEPFFVVDAEWEVVESDWACADLDGAEDDGFAVGDEDASAGAEADAVDFEGERAATELRGYFCDFFA